VTKTDKTIYIIIASSFIVVLGLDLTKLDDWLALTGIGERLRILAFTIG
jgi:hypothetical protein